MNIADDGDNWGVLSNWPIHYQTLQPYTQTIMWWEAQWSDDFDNWGVLSNSPIHYQTLEPYTQTIMWWEAQWSYDLYLITIDPRHYANENQQNLMERK